MNPGSQALVSEASPSLPEKRKRGRPRKDKSLKHEESARAPHKLQRVNGNPPPQVQTGRANDSSGDRMVGQTVVGVVEAVTDDCYLLAVRVGNSNPTLRGVVFKPGHVAPVTAENDLVPHMDMIKRKETQFPVGTPTSQGRVRGQKSSRSREKNMQLVSYVGNGETSPPNQGARSAPPLQGKNVAGPPPVHPVGARGTVVPVVLQPINLTNSGLPPNQPAPHLATAGKGKHVQTVLPISIYPPNGSTSQVLSPEPQSVGFQLGMGNNGPFRPSYPSELQQGDATKGGKSSNVHLQGEGNKGVAGSSESSKSQDGDSKSGEELADMNEPLFVEPLQTRHSGHHFQVAPTPRPIENNATGRMSELLQALQENMGEDKVRRADHLASGSTAVDREPGRGNS